MKSDWQEVTIDSLKASSKNAISMGPFGSRIKVENFVSDGIPVIKGSNLNGTFIVEDNFSFLTKEKADELSASNAFRRDIVITHRGTIGQVGIIPDNSKYQRYVVSQSQLKITLDQHKVNPFFIYYFLQTPIGQHRLLQNASQVGVPAIAGASTSIKQILVPFPNKKIQDATVNFILNLDQKIELIRKQNHTLESIARTLFKYWFIDYEFPDENNLPYKSNGGAMQLSELGLVPKNWYISRFENIIGELETGCRPPGGVSKYTTGIPSIGAESITKIGDFDFLKTKYVPEEYYYKMKRGHIKDRDILIYKDGGQPGRFDIRISMFGGGFPYEKACINEHVFRLQAQKKIYQNYLYLWLSSYNTLEELRFRGAKAAIPGINSNDVKELDFLFVSEEVIAKFDKLIEPLFNKILHNSQEMSILSRLRDTLLPKLMSGEIQVK